MTQDARLEPLIEMLLRERADGGRIAIPQDARDRRMLLRALMNLRPPAPVSEAFLRVQDEYLRAEGAARGIVRVEALEPARPGVYLWQGDITTLAADAIVNAANSGMLGCFAPCHGCIDNAIHSAAGVQLRLACAAQMRGRAEPAGRARITRAYNLPCKWVIHTVGPIVEGEVTARDRALLKSCYRACMDCARENGLRNIAFCCVSTGEYRFPNAEAARIALETVLEYRNEHADAPEVIFNVFKDVDLEIYRELLGGR